MPNFSGIWNATEQFQARGENIWPAPPGAPTIGTATQASPTSVSVPFTAPACTGRFPAGISSYTAVSTPGCLTASGASSPLVVTGLTTNTAYTFRVRATGSNGTGPFSAASNSVTPVVQCATYTTPGTFTWVAPAGVTSVSAVVVGGGGPGGAGDGAACGGSGGGGGALSYANNIAVTPGTGYTVVVGAGGTTCAGGFSNFRCSARATGGNRGANSGGNGGTGGTVTIGTGGAGGAGGDRIGGRDTSGAGGGGAGGYTAAGGRGGNYTGSGRFVGVSSNGGGGGGGSPNNVSTNGGGGGGGVGIFGQGSNGTGGNICGQCGIHGQGGSGGLPTSTSCTSNAGGSYGGGGGGAYFSNTSRPSGAGGAVRIVWPGNTRSFPSTNVGP
jgi:hypothetical protein